MARLIMVVLGFVTVWSPQLGSSDAILAVGSQVDETVNVQIIVDSSGSMAAETDTGTLRIDSAKNVLQQVIEALPESESVNVGMRIYGHEGDNTDEGRSESCASSDLVVPVDGVDKELLFEEVDNLVPTGWTPLGASLADAESDFPESESGIANAVILLTDGIETCDADPVAEAESLLSGPSAVTTYVIGFGTSAADQLVLSDIATAGGGELFGASNTGQLLDALFVVLEELEVVEEGGDGSSRDEPIGKGRIGSVEDFEINVVDYVADATDIVLAENQFNEPPESGFQFALASVSVTYLGDASGDPSFDLNFQSVGNSAVGYTTFDPGCGVYPNDQYSAGELFSGGTVEFNVCWMIASEDENSLLMYVEDFATFDSLPVWFSLGNSLPPADASESDSDDPDQNQEPDEGTPDEEQASEDDVVGNSSRTDPIPLGATGVIGDFKMEVIGVTTEATDIVLDENQFNEPPPPGFQFFIATVEVTSIGDQAVNPSFDLNFQSVGDSAVGYSTFDPGCGVYPDDQYSAGELFPGGTVEFNVCWLIDSEDEDSLVMYVENFITFDSDPIWFSLAED